MEPLVILVDEQDRQVGTMRKMLAHEKGLLHRAFSVFIFNENGEMLLQQRALGKYHSPGLWTNACCSHPSPEETTIQAANRRLKEELGFSCELREIGSFTYKTPFDNGLTEHEFDHVLYGQFNGQVVANSEEVADYKWITLQRLDELIKANKDEFTFWFHLAYPILKDSLHR
jgi:isopentenyl-diphosphate Delta-isomerase